MLGAGEVIAVEDPGVVAGQGRGEGAAVEATDDRLEAVMGVDDEAAADLRLDPLELGVDGRERGQEVVERVEVGGADGRVDLGDDGEHQLDHRGEEEFASALGLSGVLEEAIELVGIEGAFEEGAVHDGDGTGLEEALEERTQLHGGDLHCSRDDVSSTTAL